jgi:hypothetical protein
MYLRLFLTWKYSSSAFRRYVHRTYKVARIAARKVSIPAIEAVIERGESVWYVYMALGGVRPVKV